VGLSLARPRWIQFAFGLVLHSLDQTHG